MHRENGIRIIAITLIAAGIAGYLTVAIAEATSYSVIQCVDYPAGIEAANAGCHEVSNNTPQILKPFMNENFKLFAIFVSSVGVVSLLIGEMFFRRKQMKGSIPEHA